MLLYKNRPKKTVENCAVLLIITNLILQHKSVARAFTGNGSCVAGWSTRGNEARGTFVPFNLRLSHLVVPLFSVCWWAPLQHKFISKRFVAAPHAPTLGWEVLWGLAEEGVGIRWMERLRVLHLRWDSPLVAQFKLLLDIIHKYKAAGPSSSSSFHPLQLNTRWAEPRGSWGPGESATSI